MNKLVKGSIAAATGIVLLMGGAGSLALWNSTADISNQSVQAGNLSVTAAGGAWNSLPTRWVPGDEYTYTANVTVVATGENIEATLGINPASVTGDADLIADTDITLAVTGVLPAGVSLVSGVYTVTAPGTYVLPVVVTVSFDEASTNVTQNDTINLNGLNFILQQVAP